MTPGAVLVARRSELSQPARGGAERRLAPCVALLSQLHSNAGEHWCAFAMRWRGLHPTSGCTSCSPSSRGAQASAHSAVLGQAPDSAPDAGLGPGCAGVLRGGCHRDAAGSMPAISR